MPYCHCKGPDATSTFTCRNIPFNFFLFAFEHRKYLPDSLLCALLNSVLTQIQVQATSGRKSGQTYYYEAEAIRIVRIAATAEGLVSVSAHTIASSEQNSAHARLQSNSNQPCSDVLMPQQAPTALPLPSTSSSWGFKLIATPANASASAAPPQLVLESDHPYPNGANTFTPVEIPGASG